MASSKTSFPLDIFPNEIILLLEDTYETLNFPIEYLASSILFASSTAIGNSYKLEFKPNFLVKPNVYMALIGDAGDVKTHTVNFALEEIEAKEKLEYKKYLEEIRSYNNLSLEEKKNEEKPYYKKTILKDFTPEALLKLHSNNIRGVSIVADELFGWIKNFDRYSNSGEQELYLSLWSGSSICVDRKGDNAIRIDDPFVNIIGTTQTKLISKLSENNRGSNGFIERIIFVLTDKKKPLLWNDKELNPKLKNNYNTLINRLSCLEYKNNISKTIKLNLDARKLLLNWQNAKRKEYFNDEITTSIQAKYEVYCLKFALILQLVHWGIHERSKKEIDFYIMSSAIKLTEYYFENALKVNDMMFNYNSIETLKEIEKNIYLKLPEEFNTKSAKLLATHFGMNKRTLHRFLNKKEIFKKIKHGYYSKV